MKEKILSLLSPTKKWYDNIIVASILSLLLIFIGQLLLMLKVVAYPLIDLCTKITGSEGSGQFMYMYSTFLGIWILFMLFCRWQSGGVCVVVVVVVVQRRELEIQNLAVYWFILY